MQREEDAVFSGAADRTGSEKRREELV